MNINDELVRTLYWNMLRIRLVEEKLAELYPQQEMRCPVHLCIGQEAVAAGVCANLSSSDYVMSGHRSHGHYLARGGDLRRMLAEIYGRATGCSGGKGGSMHLLDKSVGFLGATPIVGATIPIGVGTAFAASLRGEQRVSVVFFGEGAVEEGVFHESANFAVLKNLPVIFVCENNLYSVYSPMEVRQPKNREVFQWVAGHGLPSEQADGNDVGAVYEAAMRAVLRARNGQGPTFLEFKTYRWREHCGPYYDNNLGYRSEAEFIEWEKKCPLRRFVEMIRKERPSLLSALETMKHDLQKEIDEAIVFARSSPFPSSDQLLAHIYDER